MKVAINKCYGGFSLSPLAVQEIAKAKGQPCYFFDYSLLRREYTPISLEEANNVLVWHAFTVPNPQDYKLHEHVMIDSRPDNRADPILIHVVETLGDKANGSHANIKIVEIPDGIQWEIGEYDGIEHIDEVHQTWR